MATTKEQRAALNAAKGRTTAAAAAAAAQATSVSSALSPPPTEIALGGRTFQVQRLTFNDLIRAEQAKLNLEELIAGLAVFDLECMRTLVWFLLNDPSLTVDQVGQLMPATGTGIARMLVDLIEASGLETQGEGGSGNDGSSPIGA